MIHSPAFMFVLRGFAVIGTAALVVVAAFGAGRISDRRILRTP
jgi:hypothetical protein